MKSINLSTPHNFKRSVKLFIAVVIIALVAPQFAQVRTARADDGGYPWIDAVDVNVSTYDWGYLNCPSSSTGCMLLTGIKMGQTYGEADPWVYYVRNCTSYAAWKMSAIQSVSGWGNATSWDNNAPSTSVKVPGSGSTAYVPVVGDLAQWDNAAGGLGHVAYVSSVDSSGVATLAEYNSGYPLSGGSPQWGMFYNSRTTASGSAGTPDHYIHLGSTTTYNKADIVVHDTSNNWSIAHSTGSSFAGVGVGMTGWGKGDWSGTGDINHDGKTDIVTHDPSVGNFVVATSNGTSFGGGGAWLTGWGAGDWDGLADVNNDQYADLVIHVGSTFYVATAKSTGGFNSPSTWLTGWGAGDWAGLGDLTGDGKADLVVHNPATNTFAVGVSTGSSYSGAGNWISGWSAGDWAGIGKLDGDANADLIVHIASTNTFAVATSTGSAFSGSGNWLTGWSIGDFGGMGDVTGDGKADVVVHNPSINAFAVAASTGSSLSGAGNWITGWSAGDLTLVGDLNNN